MNFVGILIGVITLLTIGIFHPIVIKTEYYWGKRIWWLYLLVGMAAAALSLLIKNMIVSTILGVFAFSSFWSIIELFQQEKRVKKGWFPANPKKKKQ